MSKKVLIVLQTREISERRHLVTIDHLIWVEVCTRQSTSVQTCLHWIQWCIETCKMLFTWKKHRHLTDGPLNNTKVTEFTYYKHHLFIINFVLSTFTRYLMLTTLYAMENESEKKNRQIVLFKTQVQFFFSHLEYFFSECG